MSEGAGVEGVLEIWQARQKRSQPGAGWQGLPQAALAVEVCQCQLGMILLKGPLCYQHHTGNLPVQGPPVVAAAAAAVPVKLPVKSMQSNVAAMQSNVASMQSKTSRNALAC